MYEIVSYRRAIDFLRRAEAWLLEREADNNLIIGVASHVASADADKDDHLFVTVEKDDAVVGCAFRTPPWKLFVTDCPADAIDELVDLVHGRYPALTAILGPKSVSRSFALAWSRRYETTFRPSLRQRIYELQDASGNH